MRELTSLREESLRLLQTDCHRSDDDPLRCARRFFPNTDVFEALQQLKNQAAFGRSARVCMAKKRPSQQSSTADIDCLQIAYNVLDRRLESKVFALAEQRDVGLVARSVLLKGALTRPVSTFASRAIRTEDQPSNGWSRGCPRAMSSAGASLSIRAQPSRCHKRRSPAREVLQELRAVIEFATQRCALRRSDQRSRSIPMPDATI